MPTCQCTCLRLSLCGLARPKRMWLSNADGCFQRSSEDNQFTVSRMMERLNRTDTFINGIRPFCLSVDFTWNNYTLQTNCNFQPFIFHQTFILCVWHWSRMGRGRIDLGVPQWHSQNTRLRQANTQFVLLCDQFHELGQDARLSPSFLFYVSNFSRNAWKLDFYVTAPYFEILAKNLNNLKTFWVSQTSGLKGGCSLWTSSCHPLMFDDFIASGGDSWMHNLPT